jgi:hypothetical protein
MRDFFLFPVLKYYLDSVAILKIIDSEQEACNA